MSTTTSTELAAAAHQQRTRNLGAVLRKEVKLPDGGNGFQRRTLEAFRFAGLSGFLCEDGTVKGSLLVPAASGGYTEEWTTLVSPADVTKHLGHPYAT